MRVCAHECAERQVEGIRSLKVGVTGSCRMPSLLCGAEIQTQVSMVMLSVHLRAKQLQQKSSVMRGLFIPRNLKYE